MNTQELVLSAFVPRTLADKADATKALEFALKSKVSSKCFDEKYGTIFAVIVQHSLRETVLDKDILDSYLLKQQGLTEEDKTEYQIIFNSIKEQTTPFEKLKIVLPGFLEEQASKEYSEIIVNSAKILNEGLQLNKQSLQGYKQSRQYLIKSITDLQSLDSGSFPQSDIKASIDDFLIDYENAKKNPNIGCKTGTDEIDALTHGVQKGELWVVSAYSGEGKSTLMRNWAYNMTFMQGKNVVFASLEMPFKQVQRKFISLHSMHPKFASSGLLDRELRHASLDIHKEDFLKKTIAPDLKTCTDYGVLHTMQLPHTETVATLREKLLYLRTMFPIDCLFVDYAALLRSDVRWSSKQQIIEEIFKDLKLMALDFNDGEMLPIVTAHQISREKRDKAAQSKHQKYDIGFLADSSSVERTADLVCWLLRTDEMRTAHEIKCGIHKYRDDEVIPEFMLAESYQFGKMTSQMSKDNKLTFF